MKLPLTVSDFLDRAELVYGRRIGVVDEPDQPAESWGELTYRRMAELARAQAAGLDRLGIGQGERVAIVTQNAARLLSAFFGVSGYGRILVPVNFRLNAEEVALHRRALRCLGAARRSRARRRARGSSRREHRYVIGAETDAELLRSTRGAGAVARPDEDATATINYTSGTTARPKGVAAHAPQRLDQRDHVRLAHRRQRPRRVPAHAPDVPLQRLGHDVRGHRAWAGSTSCCARSTAPRSCAASSGTASR